MSKMLRVFDGVDIPVDYAPTQKYVTLGASDSGKTYMLAVVAEQLSDAGAFFALLDPVGKHWSLRAGADGKPDGGKKNVWVLGGQHGDIPLDPNSGELIADVVVDHPGRYVIDVSTFDTDADVHRFATAFAKRLFRRKMKDPGWPMLLMIEEAESFLPQQPQPGQQQMKGAFGRIVRQGRNHGLGVFLVFQRSAAGDKGAISQCKVLIAKRTSHKRDRDAIDDWVKANGTQEQRDEMMGALASLGVEEAYVWDPAWLQIFKRTRVLPRQTFDSSANVKHGERMATINLQPLNVDELGKQIIEMQKRADDDNPAKLRKRIIELEKSLDSAPLEDFEAAEEAVRELEEKVRELEGQLAQSRIPDELADAVLQMDSVEGVVAGIVGQLEIIAQQERRAIDALQAAPKTIHILPSTRRTAPIPRRMDIAPAPPRQSIPVDGLSRPQQKLLDGLLWFESVRIQQPRRVVLAAIVGVSSKSSGYANNLSALRTKGLVEYALQGRVNLTHDGRDVAQESIQFSPTPEGLQGAVLDMVGNAKANLLRILIDAYPDAMTREDLASEAGVSAASSGYANNLSSLRSFEVIDYPRSGYVVAMPMLFFDD